MAVITLSSICNKFTFIKHQMITMKRVSHTCIEHGNTDKQILFVYVVDIHETVILKIHTLPGTPHKFNFPCYSNAFRFNLYANIDLFGIYSNYRNYTANQLALLFTSQAATCCTSPPFQESNFAPFRILYTAKKMSSSYPFWVRCSIQHGKWKSAQQ